ncbi:MAG: winged helix-turn-helix transcriptional regulator [Methanobacteriota archaeon]
MAKATAAVRMESEGVDCPVIDGTAKASYLAARKASIAFSGEVLKFLEGRAAGEKAAWLATSVEAARTLLAPWNLETLFVIAVLGRARFTELHRYLGLSTRTLSLKLKSLREAGLIDREVFDEQPVRIEYFATKHGIVTASLAGPLMTHVNLETLRKKSEG